MRVSAWNAVAALAFGLLGSQVSLSAEPTAAPAPAMSAEQIARLSHVPDDAPPPLLPEEGPYWVAIYETPRLPNYTIYEPHGHDGATMGSLPVVVFGNGGCFNDNREARELLRTVASHGYLVIAPGPLSPMERGSTRDNAMPDALDWAQAETESKGSPFHGRLDVQHEALMGWSCGGLQVIHNAADPRVKSAILFDSGVMTDRSMMQSVSGATKEDLKRVHTPILYLIGGPSDIAYPNAEDDFQRFEGVPVMVANINVGHIGTFRHAGGGWYAQEASRWLEWTLRADKRAGGDFRGARCGLCTNPLWTVQRKNLDQ